MDLEVFIFCGFSTPGPALSECEICSSDWSIPVCFDARVAEKFLTAPLSVTKYEPSVLRPPSRYCGEKSRWALALRIRSPLLTKTSGTPAVRTLEVQALTQLEGLENIPMDHLLTTILEDRENLGQQNTRSTLLGTALDSTKMAQVEEKKEEAIEARNRSRCLLAPDLLTDRWTPPFSPILFYSSLLPSVVPVNEQNAWCTHARAHPTYLSHVPQLFPCLEGVFYSGAAF